MAVVLPTKLERGGEGKKAEKKKKRKLIESVERWKGRGKWERWKESDGDKTKWVSACVCLCCVVSLAITIKKVASWKVSPPLAAEALSKMPTALFPEKMNKRQQTDEKCCTHSQTHKHCQGCVPLLTLLFCFFFFCSLSSKWCRF